MKITILEKMLTDVSKALKSLCPQKKDVENFKKWAEKSEASFENIKKTAFRFLGVPYM